MKLCIDSTNNLVTKIKLDDQEYIKEVDSPRNQNVFGFLMQCLEDRGITIADISEIEVNPGPGSFTGSRVGVAIANALSYGLNVKLNGKNIPVDPIYSSPPSITLPKQKSF